MLNLVSLNFTWYVDCKEFYSAIGYAKGTSPTKYNRWLQMHVTGRGEAYEDYIPYKPVKKSKGRPEQKFYLSLPFARELSTLLRTEEARKVRNWLKERMQDHQDNYKPEIVL